MKTFTYCNIHLNSSSNSNSNNTKQSKERYIKQHTYTQLLWPSNHEFFKLFNLVFSSSFLLIFVCCGKEKNGSFLIKHLPCDTKKKENTSHGFDRIGNCYEKGPEGWHIMHYVWKLKVMQYYYILNQGPIARNGSVSIIYREFFFLEKFEKLQNHSPDQWKMCAHISCPYKDLTCFIELLNELQEKWKVFALFISLFENSMKGVNFR